MCPFSPLLGIALAGYLIAGLGSAVWLQFGAFLLAGVVVYACYGYRHSRLRRAAFPDGSSGASPGGSLTD